MNETLAAHFADLGIRYRHFTHPAVFSVADIELLPEKLPGVDTKNLFLRDEKRTRYVLVCVRAETRVYLKELGRALGLKGITFASSEDMLEMLGVTPGSVCLFSLMNDTGGRVKGYLDASIDLASEVQNHPLINTATVVLEVSDMLRFCERVGHPLEQIEIPVRLDG
jgi:Ala-tRNA(Pro) deacylase